MWSDDPPGHVQNAQSRSISWAPIEVAASHPTRSRSGVIAAESESPALRIGKSNSCNTLPSASNPTETQVRDATLPRPTEIKQQTCTVVKDWPLFEVTRFRHVIWGERGIMKACLLRYRTGMSGDTAENHEPHKPCKLLHRDSEECCGRSSTLFFHNT